MDALQSSEMLKVSDETWFGMLHMFGLKWQLPELSQALISIRAIVINQRFFNAFANQRHLPFGFESRLETKICYDWLHEKIMKAKEGDIITFFANNEM